VCACLVDGRYGRSTHHGVTCSPVAKRPLLVMSSVVVVEVREQIHVLNLLRSQNTHIIESAQ
jgi:hypothetical protein